MSTKTTQHTPLPWAIGFSDGSGAGDDGYTITSGAGPGVDARDVLVPVRSGRDDWGAVMGIENPADAELIVRAVNSHAELLEAAEYAYDEQNRQGWVSVECFARLRDAIHKAKGQP